MAEPRGEETLHELDIFATHVIITLKIVKNANLSLDGMFSTTE